MAMLVVATEAANMLPTNNREDQVAKDKKARKADKPKLEVISGGAAEPKKSRKAKKGKKGSGEHNRGLEALGKVLDHPLVGDLLAVGALAAVAAIAESGTKDPAAVKSKDAVKTAGKAAAAAIGARLLKEVTGGDAKKSEAKKA